MADHLPVPADPAGLPATRLRDALGSARAYAENEKAAGTRRAYATDVALFAAWCDGLGLVSMPAAVATVAAYLAALADAGLTASTINRRCAAIADRHKRHGYETPTAAEPVRAVLRGIRRTIGTRATGKAPATDKHIRAMVKALPDTVSGCRDRALLLFGFATAMRRSELVALDLGALERAPEGVLVHIARSKTDQEGAGHTIAVLRGGKLGVLEALEAWIARAELRDGPLFRSVDKGGAAGGRLTDQSVALIVKRAARQAGFDPALFAGHSLRSGLVTTALAHGADVLKVMQITRHKQVDTLRRYDRRANAFKQHAGKGFL